MLFLDQCTWWEILRDFLVFFDGSFDVAQCTLSLSLYKEVTNQKIKTRKEQKISNESKLSVFISAVSRLIEKHQ